MGVLDAIERVGNMLPEPAVLFVLGALIVMGISQVASWQGWQVQPRRLVEVTTPLLDAGGIPVIDPATGRPRTRPVLDHAGRPVTRLEHNPDVNGGTPITARGLLSGDGLYWAISSMVDNFVRFPPLGVVLVAMFGIGVAERSGFIGAGLKAFMLLVPPRFLTPTVVFLGIMSSLGTDAGYVVLPPVAAALYRQAGRSPLAGIAAVFAGIGAGFNANLLLTSLDPLLAGFTGPAAQAIDPNYRVNPACNLYFMQASTIVMTGAGWLAAALFVDRRLDSRPEEEGGAPRGHNPEQGAAIGRLAPREVRGLAAGLAVAALATGVFVAFWAVPGAPFDDRLGMLPDAVRGPGLGDHFNRWVESIVPVLFLLFLIPGLVHGVVVGTIRSGRSAAAMLTDTMASMAPMVVLAFFAAQFIAYFSFSNLDKMLAYRGGELLVSSGLGAGSLIIAFILVTMFFNLFVASMSAKYAIFAPVFVPMFMLAGISPELTQAAYRVGDSCTNVMSPLNPYLVIILVVMRQHAPRAGLGTLFSMMTPYALVFGASWMALLLLWMKLGIPLGVGGAMVYPPPAGG
jgi:aminobenzoyl-glutamate transport protein